MSYEKRKRGRPSVADQIEFDHRIRPYYLQTGSIDYTAENVKLNHNTVEIRYKKWDAEELAKLNAALDEGDNKFRLQFLQLNQSLIDKTLSQFNAIEADISNARANGDKSLPHLISAMIKIISLLEFLGERRCAVSISPGAQRAMSKKLDAQFGAQPHV